MEVKELKNKSVKELNTLLNFLQENLRDLRFKNNSKQLKNVREIRKVKKDIARVLTVLQEKRDDKRKKK